MFFAFIFTILTPVFAADAPKTNTEKAIASFQLRDDYKSVPESSFIRRIVDAHEQAFPGALKHSSLYYYTPLKRLSFIQQGLVASLLQTPKALAEFQARLPMADITVTVEKPLSINTKKLDSYRWSRFRDSIASYLRAGSGWNNSISKALSHAKEDWIKATQRAGANPSMSRQFLRDIGVIYVMLSTLAKNNPSATYYGLINKINEMDVGSLDYLVDEHQYMPILDYSKSKSKDADDFRTEIKRQMTKAHAEIIDNIYSSGLQMELRAGDQITIREVHPNIAILRGYVGNDCSTSFSPGFVFTPYDRYFYVFDKDNSVLGYVGISMVKIKKDNVVFLHTIQGPDFTEAQVDLVMRGLTKSLSAFNATQIVLAEDSNISANVNFEPIRKTMMQAVAGVSPQEVKWLDKPYREFIALWDSTMTYDDPDRNRLGRALTYKDDVVSVQIQQTPFKAEFEKPTTDNIKNIFCELKLVSRNSFSISDGYDY